MKTGKAGTMSRAAGASASGSPSESFGSTKARIVKNVGKHEIDRVTKTIFGEKKSYQELADMVGAPDNGTVSFSIYGRYSIGVEVAGPGFHMDRTIIHTDNGPKINNESFVVAESHQKSGIGFQALGRQIEHASKQGVKYLDIFAAKSEGKDGYVGYKVWPKFGYNANLSAEKKAHLGPKFSNVSTIGELYQTPGGKEAWEKHGTAIHMKFDLTPGSYSRRTWSAYVKAKRGK